MICYDYWPRALYYMHTGLGIILLSLPEYYVGNIMLVFSMQNPLGIHCYTVLSL